MIHALDAAVAVMIIGACRNFALALQLLDSVRQLGAELEAVVGKTNGAYRGMNLFTRISAMPSAVSSVAETAYMSCTPAETVGEKENVGIPLGSDREGAEVVNVGV